jgi:mannose-6-phosphate isomerase-like protein (cupin superfamily)
MPKAKLSPQRIARFLAQHAKDAPFVGRGLRSFFEYRDLGISEATGGRYGGHVVRAVRAGQESTGVHFHAPDAQIIYILKGWLKAEYAGQGIVTLEAGACLHNPPGNAHNVFEFSEDLEFIEITAPADYPTVDVESVDNPVPVQGRT